MLPEDLRQLCPRVSKNFKRQLSSLMGTLSIYIADLWGAQAELGHEPRANPIIRLHIRSVCGPGYLVRGVVVPGDHA